MRFSKVVGKVDKALVAQAEEKLGTVFTELSLKYDNPAPGSGIGGDPFIFTLVYPVEQVCTDGIKTAATDGKRYYWNAEFVLKLSRIGLRMVVAHEAFHAVFMHPNRRGSRLPWLWNIAVDYIVNFNIMNDFRARNHDPVKMFKEHLGDYLELKRYVELLKGAELKGKDKDKTYFFADPELSEEMRKPEAIYEFLYNQIPKCAKCGKPDPNSNKKDKGQKQKGKNKGNEEGEGDGEQEDQQGKGKGQQPGEGSGQGDKGHGHGDGHDHGEGDGSGGDGEGDGQGSGDGQGGGSGHCDHDSGDPTGYGGLVDDHMDADISQDEMAKRLADAAEISRKLAGTIPSGFEDEIGELLAPKMRWEDLIRSKIQRTRQGNGRNDYNRFKTRPMFANMMVPKRKEYFATFRCLLDTSGSMSADDMAYGISQLQSIDERGEGTITPADAQIYWDDTVQLKRANREELSKVKVVGRGGTMFCNFFDEYEQKLGKADFLIIITDGYLLDEDMRSMKKPNCEVYWILTSSHNFRPNFGKVFDLKNE